TPPAPEVPRPYSPPPLGCALEVPSPSGWPGVSSSYATSLASRRWFVLRGDAGHADQDLCPQYPRRYWDGNLNLSRSRTDGNLRQWPMPRVRHLALPTFRPPFRFATVRTAFLASLHHVPPPTPSPSPHTPHLHPPPN